MDNLAGYFTKEKDILYRLGEREGIEKVSKKASKKVKRKRVMKS